METILQCEEHFSNAIEDKKVDFFLQLKVCVLFLLCSILCFLLSFSLSASYKLLRLFDGLIKTLRRLTIFESTLT